jgi:hypothetical protein
VSVERRMSGGPRLHAAAIRIGTGVVVLRAVHALSGAVR